jgi:site-specific DNA-methyltransferase (adenine-specific)
MIDIYHGDNIKVLDGLPSRLFSLVYIDPPFNTGKKQQGKAGSYEDSHDDYINDLQDRIESCVRTMMKDGQLFVHLDYREVHYAKVMLDELLGRKCFMQEIIWSYDYGGRPKRRWPAKHDTILWYALDPKSYTFNAGEIDRIPYMAPSLCGAEKASRGKTPTDVWWNTIVPTSGSERTGYPTQKPRGIIDRIVRVHSNPGEWLLDFFAGSGTLGESAEVLGRNCVLVDQNLAAIEVMQKRFSGREWRLRAA